MLCVVACLIIRIVKQFIWNPVNELTHLKSRVLCFCLSSPSCQSPESPGLQSPGPLCRHTDIPPHCAAPRCRDAPSLLTTGRGNCLHTSLQSRDDIKWVDFVLIMSLQTAHNHAHCENCESREFTLWDGVVLYLFLFLIRLCRENQWWAREQRQKQNNKAQWEEQSNAVASEIYLMQQIKQQRNLMRVFKSPASHYYLERQCARQP